MQEFGDNFFLWSDHLSLSALFAFPPQQFAIDLGDLFQLVFQLVVVFNPSTNLTKLRLGNDAAGCAARPQCDSQIPHRAVSLTTGALARRVAAGYVALHQ